MPGQTEAFSDANGRGAFSSRPAAGIPGRRYHATDIGVIYRDNGTTWDVETGTSASSGGSGSAIFMPRDGDDAENPWPMAAPGAAAAGGSAISVTEVDGSPVDAAVTGFVFPNDTVSIASHIATIRQVPYGFIGCRVYNNANLSRTSSDFSTYVTFNSEAFDTDGFHDIGSNTERLTIPAGLGGKYLVTADVEWASNSSGIRYLYLSSSSHGIEALANQTPISGDATRMSLSTVMDLAAGDYIVLLAVQTSGGALNLVANASYTPAISLVKLDSGKVGGGIGVSAWRSTAQSIPTGTATAISFDSELFDTDNFHDNSTNPTRVTVPAGLAGKYLLTGVCEWSPVSTGEVISYFRKNGTGTAYALMRHTGATGVDYDYSFSYVLDLAAGDYVELIVQQGQGSSVNLQTRSGGSPALIMMRLDSGSVDVLRAHGCRVNRTTGSVSVGNNTYTVIGYDAEKYDTDSMHDTGSNTSRIVIPAIAGVTTGLWSFKMSGYTDASSGRVDAMFRKNSAGSSVGGSIIGFTIQAASATGLSGYLAYGNEVLSAGDYIETFVRTSAASGNVLYDSDAGPVFEVAFLGKVT